MRPLLAALTLCISLLCPGALPVRAQQAASQRDKQSQTVYITRSGKKYHLDGCRYLTGSKTAISLKDAQKQGYTPCKVCHPPE
jgi:micrococcal nuclease